MIIGGARTVFLHIGRGKSGSTTIQSFVKENAAFMAAAGFHCPLIPNGMANHARLAASLPDRSADRAPIGAFRRDLERSPHAKLFLSAEALLPMPKAGINLLKRLTADRDVRLLAYIRPYPDWLRSLYAQRTKRATSVLDFDGFFAETESGTSALSSLEVWAKAFGWQALRVRPLEASALAGGTLLTDLLDALEIRQPPPPVEDGNVSPHWITLELMRALAKETENVDMKSVRVIYAIAEQCAEGVAPRVAQYLTPAQWHALDRLYTEDMEVLGQYMGRSFPNSATAPGERPFLPSFDVIPSRIKADILTGLRGSPLRRRVRPDVVQVLESLLKS